MKRVFLTLAATSSIFVGCSSDSGGAVTVPMYRGEPNADDAALRGILVVEGHCLYVEAGDGERYLPAFPEIATQWDDNAGELTLGDRVARPGDKVLLGGSQNTRLPTTIEWEVGPHNSCDTERLWMSGASIVVEP